MKKHPALPRLPAAVRIMNSMERAGRVFINLEADKLLDSASRKTGLFDYGNGGFREGLSRLVDSLEQDAALTTLGRLAARGTLMQAVENRLAVVDCIKKHPGISGEEIRRPLFIIGLPRSGTTILQALLDQDPANRSLLSWEALSPCPPPVPGTYGSDPRIGMIQKQFDRLYDLIPEFMAAHPMSSEAPQECVTLFCMEFLSQQFFVQFNVSSYQAWLDGRDMGPAYAFHRLVLKLLQSGGVRGERWLLKSPAHLNCIDTLLAEYPDAAIIHTHRDPVGVAASLASLISMLRGISSDRVDPHGVARQILDWYEKLLSLSLQQRRRNELRGRQFFDLALGELVKDPVGSVEKIYDYFGFPLSAGVRQRMALFIKDNPREKHGSHNYRAEDFGIDTVRESRRFKEYMEYFCLYDN